MIVEMTCSGQGNLGDVGSGWSLALCSFTSHIKLCAAVRHFIWAGLSEAFGLSALRPCPTKMERKTFPLLFSTQPKLFSIFIQFPDDTTLYNLYMMIETFNKQDYPQILQLFQSATEEIAFKRLATILDMPSQFLFPQYHNTLDNLMDLKVILLSSLRLSGIFHDMVSLQLQAMDTKDNRMKIIFSSFFAFSDGLTFFLRRVRNKKKCEKKERKCRFV